jgi:mannose-6-phosphate isomerase-like protein (cupin superfamily)
MKAFELAELSAQMGQSGERYLEFIREADCSVGIYRLAAGAIDPQGPHTEEEIYYVASGRGMFRQGDEDRAVGPGSLIFVPARAEHRFHSISEDLTIVVFFAPAEGARASYD